MNAQRSGFFCQVQSSVINWWLGKEESLYYMEGFHGSGLKVVHIFPTHVSLGRTQSHGHT